MCFQWSSGRVAHVWYTLSDQTLLPNRRAYTCDLATDYDCDLWLSNAQVVEWLCSYLCSNCSCLCETAAAKNNKQKQHNNSSNKHEMQNQEMLLYEQQLDKNKTTRIAT